MTGYAGLELARLLWHHPEVELVSVTGRSAAGKRLPEVLPHLWAIDLPVTERVEGSLDVVFSALPSGASAEALAPLVEDGVKAVDIAADFRLHDPETFKRAYKVDHPAPKLLKRAVYGLPELHREAIRGTSLVANPGCYPEAAILALAPAVREGLVADDIIVDAKSGISGAGRGGLATNIMDQFAEANENVVAYGLDGHGHQPGDRPGAGRASGGREREGHLCPAPYPHDSRHPGDLLRASPGRDDGQSTDTGSVRRVLP